MSLVAKNLFNLVLVLDLSQPDQINFIVDLVPQYIARKIPVRFGIVPVVAEEGHEVDDPATAVGAVMWHLVDTVGRSMTLKVLGEVMQHLASVMIDLWLSKVFLLIAGGHRQWNPACYAGRAAHCVRPLCQNLHKRARGGRRGVAQP